LTFLEPVHEHRVIGSLDAGAGQGIVADFLEASLPGGLDGLESGVMLDSETHVGIRGFGRGPRGISGQVGTLVHTGERIEKRLEKGFTASISSFLLQMAAAGLGFLGSQALATLEQGHLGGEVAALPDLDQAMPRQALGRKETDVVRATVAAGTYQPEAGRSHG
jgi:hypothetical protein